jgi:DNA-binding response OmpR family regulator
MKVMIVEEEGYIAELIQQILENMGNSCVLAETAEVADRILKEQAIDAVTLDLGMPGRRSGLDWLETVVQTRPDLAQRTLIVTGQSLGPEKIERLARCGAGILAKPFSMESLREAVRTQLARVDHEQTGSD